MSFRRAIAVLLVAATPVLASASARTDTGGLRRDLAGAAYGSEGGQVAAPPTPATTWRTRSRR